MTTGKRPSACHVACVVNVQVRNVDDEVVRRLKARAAQRGQNLQGFLAEVLSAEAAVAVAEHLGVELVTADRRPNAAPGLRRGVVLV